MKEVWEKGFQINQKLVESDSFIKYEGYAKPKMARGINSYTDESKTLFGPVFQAIDKAFFQSRFFVKGMDVTERPTLLADRFGSRPVVETDFTSFESHHRQELAEIVFYWMMHMARGLNLPSRLRRLLATAVLGCNVTKFSTLRAHVPQTLMSGALWTSSSNALLNLLVMSYLWSYHAEEGWNAEHQARYAFAHFDGLIEGDDGICSSFNVDKDLIDRLGVDLKLETVANYGLASFCGIVCPVGHKTVLYNPKKFARNFFWIPSQLENSKPKQKNAYLRAKALSYLHSFPQCPVIAPISYEICKRTSGTNICNAVRAQFDNYKWDQISKAVKDPSFAKTKPVVPLYMREHMEKVFSVSINMQLEIEQSMGKSVDLSEWMMPWDDLHNSLHVTQFDWRQYDRWRPSFMPPIIEKVETEGQIGPPTGTNANRRIWKSG